MSALLSGIVVLPGPLGLVEPTMGTGGWTFLILAWVLVTGLLVWCFWRVLGGRSRAS